ncbi:hypothetical protein [Granulicella tundricola]|uniref:Lipoprotein n=1 Tax=Granulicella tundricola (strain ATCC BAA-1859 / DSM 23138 / MP5ACTX9) TaxID=1198114 RepID=E8X4W0_GRATM|nr:hypothetical protein [Granulicella tundricola]ADW70599.1 hypothetical protein AciX9_3596 [Granulicella tundricola MP5ACTX9]
MKDFGAKLTLILTFFAAALLLMAACYAQPGPLPDGPGGGPPTVEQELARMTWALALSEAQGRAILPILEDRHYEVGALMRNGAGREANEAQVHAIFEETDGEIKVLLAEEQQAIFDAMRPPRPPDGATARVDRIAGQ